MGLIRVMLAMAVVLSHLPMASFKFLSGGLAVQSFFIISGFYMSLILSGKYSDTNLFYTNRLLRLFPTYFIMCALTAIAVWVFNASPTASPELFAEMFANPVSAVTLAASNLTLLGQDLLFWFEVENGALVFHPGEQSENATVGWQGLLVPQAWSLSIELMFYAIAPFLVRLRTHWIVALACASIALRLAGHLVPGLDYLLWQGRFFPTCLFMFLLGMLGHRFLPLVARLPKALGWVAMAGLFAYIVLYSFIEIAPLTARWVTYGIVSVTTPFIFNAFRDNAADRWIGELSYPIYMAQLLVIGAVLTFETPFPIWTSIACTIALSVLILVLVDHPIDRWRQRRAAKARAAPFGAAGAAQPA